MIILAANTSPSLEALGSAVASGSDQRLHHQAETGNDQQKQYRLAGFDFTHSPVERNADQRPEQHRRERRSPKQPKLQIENCGVNEAKILTQSNCSTRIEGWVIPRVSDRGPPTQT